MKLNELLQISEGYIVGGAVRNQIIGIPIHDYDVVTPFTPEQLNEKFNIAYPLGEKFGTVVVETEDCGFVELTTMRKDISSGRHPNVEFTTSLSEDLLRRDFTMNAIATKDGKIYDPFNGQHDISHKLIRCVGNPVTRINEDKLRALRAVRFSIQLNFTIGTHLQRVLSFTDLEIGKSEIEIIDGEIKLAQGVSIERVMDEFSKMFTVDPVKTLKELSQYNLLSQFIPEFSEYKFCLHNPLHHPEGNLEDHTLLMLSKAPRDYIILLCILFHDVGKIRTRNGTIYHNHDQVGASMIPEIASRLKFSVHEREAIKFVCANHMKMHNIEQMRPAKRHALYVSPYWNYLYEVHKLDGDNPAEHFNFIEDDFNKVSSTPKPIITGREIMQFGITGSAIIPIKEEMYSRQISGEFSTTEEGIQILRNII